MGNPWVSETSCDLRLQEAARLVKTEWFFKVHEPRGHLLLDLHGFIWFPWFSISTFRKKKPVDMSEMSWFLGSEVSVYVAGWGVQTTSNISGCSTIETVFFGWICWWPLHINWGCFNGETNGPREGQIPIWSSQPLWTMVTLCSDLADLATSRGHGHGMLSLSDEVGIWYKP